MLLERDAEFATVREALRAAGEGQSSQLLLAGPLGTGRSSLLRELPGCADPGTVYVLRANAAPAERDFPFGVVRQLFDSLSVTGPRQAGTDAPQAAEAALRVLDDVAPDTGPPTDRALDELRALLAGLCTTHPVLLLVDDLQWADTWSLRWLAHLASRRDGLRLLVVCTLRDGDPGSGDPLVQEVAAESSQVLRPAPLSLPATEELVRVHLGESPAPEFARTCYRSSRGNPLHLESVLRGLATTGCRPLAANAALVRTLCPPHLRERILGCLLSQPKPIRDVAAAIAVLGEQSDPEPVGRLAGLDDVGFAAALRSLRRLGLLAGATRARFPHRVVRDAVVSSMSAAERQRLHEEAAGLLYADGHPAEQVAAQLMALPAARYPWSAAVLRSAADTALRRGAPEQAVRWLRRALLDAVDQDGDRASLLVELAAAERAVDPAAAELHVAQALPLLPSARDRAAAVLRLAPRVTTPLTPSVLDLLQRVGAELGGSGTGGDRAAGAGEFGEAGGAGAAGEAGGVGEAGEEALRVEARLRYAQCEDHAQLVRSAARLRELEPAGPDVAFRSRGGRELRAVLLLAAMLGAEGEAEQIARQAGALLEWEPATAPGRQTVAPLLLFALVGADAVRTAESWLNAAERDHGRRTPADALGHEQRALVHVARGRLSQARTHAEQLLQQPAGDWESRCFSLSVLAALALSAGDRHLGAQVVSEASSALTGLLPTAIFGLLGTLEQTHEGETAKALETALDCGRQLEAAGWRNPVFFPWRPWAVSLSHRLGDRHLAVTLAAEEYARATEWGAPVAIGRALRLRARTDEEGRGTELLREAVEVLRDSVNELELYRAMRDLGRSLAAGPEAERVLREAGELAVSCGVPWPAGASAAGSRGPSGRLDGGLTPSESRVASLAVSGLTNQEIAVELRVSARAVEKHLTNSYRKLGISGRRELAAVLHEMGTDVPG